MKGRRSSSKRAKQPIHTTAVLGVNASSYVDRRSGLLDTVSAAFRTGIFGCAVAFALVFSFGHLISLPLSVSFDGLGYIDMADVLFSDRFPHDWLALRTPLFPLSLKLSFWLFGGQPMAAIVVSTTLALAGILLIGVSLRKLLGDTIAAAAIIILTLYPTLIVYEHYVLTEAGTFFFLALIVALLLQQPANEKWIWARTAGLIAAISIGYYWRQNIQPLAFPAALLHAWSAWRARAAACGASGPAAQARRVRPEFVIAAQVLLIMVMPFWLAKPWNKYSNRSVGLNLFLQQGILVQAVLAPEDPQIAPYGDLYRKAIQESTLDGTFYSGIRAQFLGPLIGKVFARPTGSPAQFFVGAVKRYPQRYMSAVARTLILFLGARAAEDENAIGTEMILSPTMPGSKITGGPPALLERITRDFDQKTKPCVILWLLRGLVPVYRRVLFVANAITVLGLLVGLGFRNLKLVILCAIPVAYVVPYAIFLASAPRYAFPVYPITMVNLLAVPILLKDVVIRSKGAARA